MQNRGLLHRFMRDARRLVLSFRPAFEYTPLQLYLSTLLFAPTSSIIRQTFEPVYTIPWVKQKPSVHFKWDACLQTLTGHQGQVHSMAYSADNTKLASCSDDGNIRIWDRATGACLQSLTFDMADSNMSMAFSIDSSQLALAFEETIKILDVSSSSCVMTLNSGLFHESMTFSPNGMNLILSNGAWEDGSFQVWDLATGIRLQTGDCYQDTREPAVCQLDASNEGNVSTVRSPITGSRVQVVSKKRLGRVVFALDGMRFALLMPSTIHVLDAATGNCLQNINSGDDIAVDLALSPDGKLLATAYVGRGIQIWDVQSGASFFTSSYHSYIYSSVVFSPDGTELASVLGNNAIRIWDLTLDVSVNPEEKKPTSSVTYSPDGARLALITDDYGIPPPFTIEIWDAVTGKCQQQLQVGSPGSWSSDTYGIVQLAFSPDNTQLAYSLVNKIAIWDLAANPQHNMLEYRSWGHIQSIIFSCSGTRLAAAAIPLRHLSSYSRAPTIEIWDVANGTILHKFDCTGKIIGIHFSSDSKRLGYVSENGIAAILDLDTGACLQIHNFNLQKTLPHKETRDLPVDYLQRTQSLCFITNMFQNPGSIYNATHEFDLHQGWLLRRGEPFLSIPPDYWPNRVTFTRGNIAIKIHTEELLLFSFCLAELDAEMASSRSSILKV